MRQQSRGRPVAWLMSAAPYAAVALIGGLAVLLRLLTQFNPVDDEGYVLITLSQFLHGGDLYDQVFTQYGPFYYELYGGFFKLTGLEPTHEIGRVIVTVLYVAIATGYGVLAERLTHNRLLGVGVQIISFVILYRVVLEPTHPIALTTLLVLCIVAVAALARPGATAAVAGLGALVAALTLVKINLGLPAGAALVAAALVTFAPPHRRTTAILGSGAMLGAVVLGLTASKLDIGWVRMLVFLELSGLIAIGIRAHDLRSTPEDVSLAAWITRFLVGAICAALGICALIVALGTSPRELFDGVFVAPSRHPSDTAADLFLRWWTVPAAALALAAAWLASTPSMRSRVPVDVRAGLRLAAAAAIWLSISADAPAGLDPGTTRLVAGALLAWLAIAPPPELVADDRPILEFGRLALVLVAVIEIMQAYPIGFSRVDSAALSFTVVGALIAADGLRLLAHHESRFAAHERGVSVAVIAAPTVLIVVIAVSGLLRPLHRSADAYRAGRSVDLPGMRLMHLPDSTAASYERLASAARGCDPLIVVPSFYSLYPWAGLKPPTGQNANAWPKLLESKQQREVVAAIRGRPRLCMLLNQFAEATLIGPGGRPPDRPLYRYLAATRFEPVTSIDVHTFGGQFTLLRKTNDTSTGTVGGGLTGTGQVP